MKLRPVRILLDFGFVLTAAQDVSLFDPLLAELELSRELFLSAWAKWRAAYDAGDLDEASYWRLTLEACGIGGAEALEQGRLDRFVEADFAAWSRPRPAVHELLLKLLDRGAELGILSNMPRGRGALYVAAWPWLERVAYRLFSGDLGLAKPDPAFYRHFLDRSGWTAPETLFVDDSATNIAAAAALGFAVHHFVEEEAALDAIRAWER